MKYFILLVLLSLSLAEFTYEEDVLVLTDKNIEEAMTEFEYLMIEFYAPWCGHCKEFAPKYAEAATELKNDGIVLAKFDAHEYSTVAGSKYGIKSYPTLKFSVKGVLKDYDGPRSAEGVKSFCLSNINPESELLESAEAVQELIDQNDVQFIYFAEESTEKDRELRKFRDFSYTVKQNFAHVQSKQIRETFNIPSNTYFVGFRKGERHYYDGKLQVQSMKTFVENVANDRIIDFAQNKQLITDRLFTKNKPVVIVFSDIEATLTIAKQYPYQEDIAFVKNLDEETLIKLLIRSQDQKGIFIIKGDQKYWKQESQTTGEFLAAFKENKATKYLKSQAIPNQNSPITVLVGQTYESIFNDTDTIVLYYDSQNQEHTSVEADYAKIQKRLSNNKSLKWAKIDLAQNEVSDLHDSIEVVKLRIYKGNQFTKFVIKANKLQEERFVKWVIENASSTVIDSKSEL